MRDLSPVVEMETLMLDKIRFAAQGAVTPQVLHDTRARVVVDDMTQRLLMQLQTEVLVDKRHTETWRLEEKWVYPTWVDQFHAGLPEGTFRRRWMDYFRGHGPQMSRTVHEIDYNAYASFPENTRIYPKELGPPYALPVFNAAQYYE